MKLDDALAFWKAEFSQKVIMVLPKYLIFYINYAFYGFSCFCRIILSNLSTVYTSWNKATTTFVFGYLANGFTIIYAFMINWQQQHIHMVSNLEYMQ